MSCKDCVKNDVCGQMKILEKAINEVDEISCSLSERDRECRIITKKELRENYGIVIEVKCTKFMSRNTVLRS